MPLARRRTNDHKPGIRQLSPSLSLSRPSSLALPFRPPSSISSTLSSLLCASRFLLHHSPGFISLALPAPAISGPRALYPLDPPALHASLPGPFLSCTPSPRLARARLFFPPILSPLFRLSLKTARSSFLSFLPERRPSLARAHPCRLREASRTGRLWRWSSRARTPSRILIQLNRKHPRIPSRRRAVNTPAPCPLPAAARSVREMGIGGKISERQTEGIARHEAEDARVSPRLASIFILSLPHRCASLGAHFPLGGARPIITQTLTRARPAGRE